MVQWSAASDDEAVNGYELLIDNTLHAVLAGNTLQAVIGGLSPSTAYRVTVRAFDGAGNRSPDSMPLDVVTSHDDTPPSPVGSLQAQATAGRKVFVSWTGSTDNVAVVGYDVYANGLKVASTTKHGVSLEHLAGLTSYEVTVRAFDAAGNRSEQASPVIVTVSDAPAIDQMNIRILDIRTLLKDKQLSVSYRLEQSANVTVKLFDGTNVLRRTVLSAVQMMPGTQRLLVPLGTYPQGSYRLEFSAQSTAGSKEVRIVPFTVDLVAPTVDLVRWTDSWCTQLTVCPLHSLSFRLSEGAHVTVSIVNKDRVVVRRLVQNVWLNEGEQEIRFSTQNVRLPNGRYSYRIEAVDRASLRTAYMSGFFQVQHGGPTAY
jgi:chitodextrinase